MLLFPNRQERTHAQRLRDEQDEAYYESVRADQEKVSSSYRILILPAVNRNPRKINFRFEEIPRDMKILPCKTFHVNSL